MTKTKTIFTFVLLYFCTLVPSVLAQTTKNFNFRASGATYCDGSGEVCADAANTTYVNATDTYPVTRNGITFGWTVAANLDGRDRDNSGDARFAGFNFVNNASVKQIFRVDVTAGASIAVRLAAGDFSADQTQFVTLLDNVTAFSTCYSHDTPPDEYMDADCNVYTRANWLTSNTAITRTMGSTTLFVEIGSDAAPGVANSTTLNHLSLVITAASGTIRHSVIQ